MEWASLHVQQAAHTLTILQPGLALQEGDIAELQFQWTSPLSGRGGRFFWLQGLLKEQAMVRACRLDDVPQSAAEQQQQLQEQQEEQQ